MKKRVEEGFRRTSPSFITEGDGKAWDSSCSSGSRELTENQFIRRIADILMRDPIVRHDWIEVALADLEKQGIKGKVKNQYALAHEWLIGQVKVCIDTIRESGHRGASVLNFLINLFMWLSCVVTDPVAIIRKVKKGKSSQKTQ